MTARAAAGAIAEAVAWLSLIACGLDLAGRSMARASWLAGAGLALDTWALLGVATVSAAAAAAGAWRAGRPGRTAGAVLALAFSAGMTAQLSLGARLQSDGFYYFAHLRSLWFDGDADLTNDYRLLGLEDKPHLFVPTPTGYAQTAWPVGPALMWSPFFALGDRIARAKAEGGQQVAVDGTSYPYRQAACVAGLFWGLLGLYFSYRLARQFAGAGAAIASVVLVALGSFVTWYLVKEPTMAHAPSLCAVAAFTAFWAATRHRRTTAQWAVLGLLAGLMATVRWQNALFAALPAIEWLAAAGAAWRAAGRRAAMARLARDAAVCAAMALVGLLPQMLAWKAIYGSWIAVSPISPQIRWWDSHWDEVLWSSRSGLLAMSPVLYAGLAGLVLLWRRETTTAAAAWAVLAAMAFLNGAVQDWWGGAAFGGRRFDSTVPLFILGTALACEAAVRWVARHPRVVVSVAGALLVVWNLTLMDTAQRGWLELEAPNDFGQVASRQAATLHRWIGHPFSYPATLPFALRNGVTPAQADILWPTRFLGDPTRPYGRVDVGQGDEIWLESGWFSPERDGAVTYRWASAESAIRVALDHPASLRVQVRARAFTWPGAPPQTLSLAVNGHVQPPMAVGADWQVVEQVVAAGAWRAGVNRVRLAFAYARRPSDVGASTDRRALAAAVDYLRVAVAPDAAAPPDPALSLP